MPKRPPARPVGMPHDLLGKTAHLGIDPGSSGGMALLGPDGAVARVTRMPPDAAGIYDWLKGLTYDWSARGVAVVAVLEKVWGYVGGGGNPGSAMFSFGRNYGQLQMALTSLAIPYVEIQPATWQPALGIEPCRKKTSRVPYLSKGSRSTHRLEAKAESKQEFKRRLKAAAQALFPQERVTLATADALLIAEFCRRRHNQPARAR